MMMMMQGKICMAWRKAVTSAEKQIGKVRCSISERVYVYVYATGSAVKRM